MTKDEFLIKADKGIDNNSLSRVPKTVKKIMNDLDVMFDIHMHIFDKTCVTERFFLLRLLEKVRNTGWIVNKIEELYQEERDNGFDDLFRIMDFNSMKEVLKHYKNKFAYQQKMILVPLTMDLQNWLSVPKKSLLQQINEIKSLMNTFPILPFLAVDPINEHKGGKENLYQLFLKAFTGHNKFFGIKIYPALGYLPSYPALMPIYEICEKKGIPVTTHCGGTIIRTNKTNIKLAGYQVIDNTLHSYINEEPPSNPNEFAQYMNDPKLWEPVLHKYPNLKLNLGHFGGIDIWNPEITEDKQDRMNNIKQFMTKYPNVYADFSNNLVETYLYDNFFNTLLSDDLLRSRAMFGTDYWMVFPKGDAFQGQVEFIDKAASYGLKETLTLENPKKFLFG